MALRGTRGLLVVAAWVGLFRLRLSVHMERLGEGQGRRR